jgi:exonuclease III
MGDWNFVEDKIDRSPQHDDDHGVMNEMTKLKAEIDLIDGWSATNPEARSFTWEGTTGNDRRKIFSRIDHIYTTKNTWGLTNEYRIINCDISDHDGIAVKVRNATAPDTGKGEQKLNLNIIQHPLFKKEAD